VDRLDGVGAAVDVEADPAAGLQLVGEDVVDDGKGWSGGGHQVARQQGDSEQRRNENSDGKAQVDDHRGGGQQQPGDQTGLSGDVSTGGIGVENAAGRRLRLDEVGGAVAALHRCGGIDVSGRPSGCRTAGAVQGDVAPARFE